MVKKFFSFFRIVRWPNLVIMALTMIFVRMFLMLPFYGTIGLEVFVPYNAFLFLVVGTVLVAAGGNIINDCFDVNADKVNKPRKILVGRVYGEGEAKAMYVFVTIVGLVCGIVCSAIASAWPIALLFVAEIGLLYFYSARYKSVPLFGNVVVAFSTMLVVIMPWLLDILYYKNDFVSFARIEPIIKPMALLVFAYAAFAFVATMVREVVKDLQDVEGDRAAGFRTMPIAWGVKVSKGFAIGLTALLTALVAWWQVFLVGEGKIVAACTLFAVDVVCVAVVMQVVNAKAPKDYVAASVMAKIIMAIGIGTIPLIYLF